MERSCRAQSTPSMKPAKLKKKVILRPIVFNDGDDSLRAFPPYLRRALEHHCKRTQKSIPSCASLFREAGGTHMTNCKQSLFRATDTDEQLLAARYKYGSRHQIIIVKGSNNNISENRQAVVVVFIPGRNSVKRADGSHWYRTRCLVWNGDLNKTPCTGREILIDKLFKPPAKIELPTASMDGTMSVSALHHDKPLQPDSNNDDDSGWDQVEGSHAKVPDSHYLTRYNDKKQEETDDSEGEFTRTSSSVRTSHLPSTSNIQYITIDTSSGSDVPLVSKQRRSKHSGTKNRSPNTNDMVKRDMQGFKEQEQARIPTQTTKSRDGPPALTSIPITGAAPELHCTDLTFESCIAAEELPFLPTPSLSIPSAPPMSRPIEQKTTFLFK